MAEFVMKDLVKKMGLEPRFQIASAATSTEEIGNPVYPPARRKLAEHGISCGGKTARQLTREDYAAYDLLIGMDQANIRNIRRICGGSTPAVPARRWPIPGTQAISRPPGGMYWRGAKDFSGAWPGLKGKLSPRKALPGRQSTVCCGRGHPDADIPGVAVIPGMRFVGGKGLFPQTVM